MIRVRRGAARTARPQGVRPKEKNLMDPRTPSELASTGTLPLQGDGIPATPAAPATGQEAPAWVAEARQGLTVPGKYVVFEDGSSHQVVPVQREWTSIGRSLAADIRFDD